MSNIYIKGPVGNENLNRKLNLSNGSLILVKNYHILEKVYMVIPFRDNKNRYCGSTSGYCSLLDLESGKLVFEERCSRSTTVRRVLNHILRLGFTMPYDPNSTENDSKMHDYDIDVYSNGAYKIEIELY